MMNNETTVGISIYDYVGTFDELNNIIGIKADATYEYSEDKPNKRKCWQLSSGLDKTAPVEDHISALVRKALPYKQAFKKIAADYKTWISVGIYYHEFNPEIVLSPQDLSNLNDLGLQIWFDMYYLSDDSDES